MTKDDRSYIAPENPYTKKVDTGIYNWETDSYITDSMKDSMYFSGGKWWSINNPCTTHMPPEEEPKGKGSGEPKWIKPPGKRFSYNNDRDKEQIWRDQQNYKCNHYQVTEDDIRQIIITEFQR